MSGVVFSLILIFSDGYMDGHAWAGTFKTQAVCEQAGREEVRKQITWGHPTSFICQKTNKASVPTPPAKPFVLPPVTDDAILNGAVPKQ